MKEKNYWESTEKTSSGRPLFWILLGLILVAVIAVGVFFLSDILEPVSAQQTMETAPAPAPSTEQEEKAPEQVPETVQPEPSQPEQPAQPEPSQPEQPAQPEPSQPEQQAPAKPKEAFRPNFASGQQTSAEAEQDAQTDPADAQPENAAPTSPEETVSASGAELTPAQAAEKAIPSVVCIENYQTIPARSYQSFGWFFGGSSSGQTTEKDLIQLASEGSGVILTENGYIATNAHVVEGAELLKVVFSNGETTEAELIGSDPDTDLALIKVDMPGLQPVVLGDSDLLKAGEYVMAVGNPGGMEFSSSVTLGIVSAKDRPLSMNGGYTMNTIQTDAAINPGNSGGALINMRGELVGICSAKYVANGFEGLGFALTINEAMPIIEELWDHGKVQNRSMLGLDGQILDELTASYYNLVPGFFVYKIGNEQAGDLEIGDVITAVDGMQIQSVSDLKDSLKDKAPGTKVRIDYYRGDGKTAGTHATTELTLMAQS